MEEKKLMLGILNEYEGDSTLWFPVDEPQWLQKYLELNGEIGQEYTFVLKRMTHAEVAELES